MPNFLPLLAERFARQRLQALARVEGHHRDGKPVVLFLCTHNAGRSQMALGFFTPPRRRRARSPGPAAPNPATSINPSAIAAMAERGIDITGEYPKPWTDEIVRAADVVITMGCGDACPVFPGTRYDELGPRRPRRPDVERRPPDPRRPRTPRPRPARRTRPSPPSDGTMGRPPGVTLVHRSRGGACSPSSSAPRCWSPPSSAPASRHRPVPDDVGLQLLENSIATAFALGALILDLRPGLRRALQPGRLGRGLVPRPPRRHRPDRRDLGGYVPAQTLGAIAGAVLANLMFDLAAGHARPRTAPPAHLWLGEVVATAGLLLLIFALVRSGRAAVAPAAVGAYIGAAYWFTSSTSFANPAVTIGRAFTDTFAGIAPASVPGFVVAQLVGLLVGVGPAGACLYPRRRHAPPTSVVHPSPRPNSGASMSDTKPTVLFVCVHNAGRSQMAAGWLAPPRRRHRSRSAPPAREPPRPINPAAVEAMQEVGIDITDQPPGLD